MLFNYNMVISKVSSWILLKVYRVTIIRNIYNNLCSQFFANQEEKYCREQD
jgi:hypothetical protein